MHNVLGRIRFLLNDFQKAADHYTESLAIATTYQGSTLVMINCAGLAELRLAEGRLEEARRFCVFAYEAVNRSEDVHMRGTTLLTIGKVTYAEARQADGERRQRLLEESISWFERANAQLERTQAYPDLAELYGSWAQALEDLGRVGDAIERWRSGYTFLSLKSPSLAL
jgi:tetratricopeptide (TPR) repeat protein